MRPSLGMAFGGWAAAVVLAVASASTSSPAPGTPARESPRVAVEPGDGFTGAARCGDCHADNHARWQRDWHARAWSQADPGRVVGDWNGAHFRGSSSEAWMKRDGARFLVRTLDGDGRLGDFPVRWVIGGRHMQDPVTELADGRLQVLPVYYHVTGGAWVDYTERQQGPIRPGHPFFWTGFRRTANRECLECHVTAPRIEYEQRTRTWRTRFAEAGIGCESCHGPGARHAVSADPADIVHPGRLDGERQLAVCGHCHGAREPLYPLLDVGHRFRPGQRYEERFTAIQVVQGGRLSQDFFPDGRPRTSSFEYPALLQSACHRRGGATCLSCHVPPHGESSGSELRPPTRPGVAAADAGCAACHAGHFAEAERHSRHRSAAAQSCVACHMPRIVSGVLDRFADHAIDVPVPRNSGRHRTPNACGECHGAWTADAQAAALERLWPEAGRRQERRLRLADAIDPETDAGSLAPLVAVAGDAGEAPTLRAAAIAILAGRFPAQAVTVATAHLGDPSGDVRAAAARALERCAARGSAGALRALLGDRDLRVREAAALALHSLGDAEGRAALERLAGSAESSGLWRPHFELGLDLARRGRFVEAEHSLERARELHFYSPAVLLALSDLAAVQGQVASARRLLDEVRGFDPDNPHLAGRLEALGAGDPAGAPRRRP